MKRIDVTREMERTIRRYEIAVARFVPGRDSTHAVELPLRAIGEETAKALGLPTLRELFHGNTQLTPRFVARPVKVHAAQRGTGRKVGAR